MAVRASLTDVLADAIVCGGAAIYDLMISQCDQLLVTTVKKEVEGDTFFNDGWLDDFEPADTIEATDEYSIASYCDFCRPGPPTGRYTGSVPPHESTQPAPYLASQD